MNKNDFRLQMPLWNAGFVFILIFLLFSVVYGITTWDKDFENLLENATYKSNHLAFIPFLVGAILFIIYIYLFILKVIQYNKMNPTRKINFSITITQIPEFVDDDEMMQQITNAATRKVYVYYSNMIPLILLLLFLPLHRFIYILAISLMIIGQCFIYYRHLSKFAEGKSKPHVPLFNKRIVASTFAVLFIFTVAISGLFYKLNKDFQADMQFMEENMKDCLNKGGTFTLISTTSGSDFKCTHE